jgi:heterodisulfide reductase subunit B
MKVGYFPGCSLHATAKEFDESLRAVAGQVDLELDEIKDWSCCGATSAHATNHLLSVGLAARNLWLAHEQKHEQVMAPCAACYSRLAVARHAITHDDRVATRVRAMLGSQAFTDLKVLNVVDLFQSMLPVLTEKVVRPLAGLKVACYYGCLLVRPSEVTGCAEPDAPTAMEEIVRSVGATPVPWNMSLSCCGGGFSISRTGSVLRLGRMILADARAAGAQALVVACPMCQSNLDLRQNAMARRGESSEPLPILYLTQLIGLAFGMSEADLGLRRHFVSPAPVLQALQAPLALPAAREES